MLIVNISDIRAAWERRGQREAETVRRKKSAQIGKERVDFPEAFWYSNKAVRRRGGRWKPLKKIEKKSKKTVDKGWKSCYNSNVPLESGLHLVN